LLVSTGIGRAALLPWRHQRPHHGASVIIFNCSAACDAACFCSQVLDVLRDCRGDISVQDISDRTMMMPSDIIETLKQLNLLQVTPAATSKRT
jgi:hypothetical protein